MNSKIALTLLMSAAVSSGATVGFENFTGTASDDFAILDSSDAPLSSGFIGLFAATATQPSDPSSIVSILGSETALASQAIGAAITPNAGAILTSLSFDNTAGTFNGVNLLFVIGNGADIGSSTEFALFDTGLSATTSDAPIPEDLGTFNPSSATAIVGNSGTVTVDFSNLGQPSYATNSISLEAVPEPSSAVLALLGGVVLLRRRRA